MKDSLHVIILAAGKGKRMRSKYPKVVHPLLFRPLIHYTLDIARGLAAASVSVIVGHEEQSVRKACAEFPGLQFFRQEQQLGTAHAVKMAEGFLKPAGGLCLVLNGDVPLLQLQTLQKLIEIRESTGASAALVSTTLPNPQGYGRILRNAAGEFVDIREEADCSDNERRICEGNAGVYLFETALLLQKLAEVKNENKQGEFYLPDVVKLIGRERKVSVYEVADYHEVMGINDRLELSYLEKVIRERINQKWMRQGVTLTDPLTTVIDPRCQFEGDVVIEGGTTLINSQFAADVRIESGCRIVNSKVGESTHLKQGSYIEDSQIGGKCSVGPYAHLRPGSELADSVKIGNFVELKKAKFHRGAKASHLSYIGDAEIGEESNLGCGFVTCNYDGVNKHKTVIGKNVFVGSDSQVVAPVNIGSGSYVASGTTVTEDVPDDSLVISRGRQVTKPGYAKRYQPKKA